VEEFRTSIFEKTREKSRKRLLYNLGIIAAIVAVWSLYLMSVPFIGLWTSVSITATLMGMKLYDDKYMGISAYGERKANLAIAEDHLEIRGIRIPYTDLKDLVIYVDEYLGMPREYFGIHHGGNNKIEFNHKGRLVSINYVIKNKQDYDRVYKLVVSIENNAGLKMHLKKL
jgi:hypothetical protein